MKRKNPIIISSERDGQIVTIEFVDGRKYRLQHPGNRTYMEWQNQSFDLEKGLDTITFMDNAFEYCVIPEGHDFRPTIDNVKPAELEVWQKLLRRFLRGDLDSVPEAGERETKRAPAKAQPGS
jgi:hypothetical protein